MKLNEGIALGSCLVIVAGVYSATLYNRNNYNSHKQALDACREWREQSEMEEIPYDIGNGNPIRYNRQCHTELETNQVLGSERDDNGDWNVERHFRF